MKKPRPLSPRQARSSLVARLGRVADRVRQIATDKGARPYRVFLRWTRWDGTERGQGHEHDLATVEVLPTPLVTSLDSVSFSLFHAGTVPVGSVRVQEISGRFTEDELRGLKVPLVDWGDYGATGECALPDFRDGDSVKEPFDFFYEVVEDGRHDDPPRRMRFRLLNEPMYRADSVDWSLMLERTSPDRQRGKRGGVSPFH